jgi:hypothetical protein
VEEALERNAPNLLADYLDLWETTVRWRRLIANRTKKFTNARAAGAQIGDITRRMHCPSISNPGETYSEVCGYRGRGALPHDALLASAGVRAREVEELRDQAKHLAQELSQVQEMGARLQHTLNMTGRRRTRRPNRVALKRKLQNAGEIEKENRQRAPSSRTGAAKARLRNRRAGRQARVRKPRSFRWRSSHH